MDVSMDVSGASKYFLDSMATIPSQPNAEKGYRGFPPPSVQSFQASCIAFPPPSQSANHISNGANDHASISVPFPGDLHRRDQCLPCPQFMNSPNNLTYQSSLNQLRPSEEVSMSNINFEKPKRVRKGRMGPKPKQEFSDTLKFAADVDFSEYEPHQQQSIFTPTFPTSAKPKRRRTSSKAESNADSLPENAENPHVPKRPMSKGRVQNDNPSSSMSNVPVSSNRDIQDDSNSLKGILGSYGMDPKTLDFIQYMKDAPLEGLIPTNFNFAGYIPKQEPTPSTSSFGLNVQNGNTKSLNGDSVLKPGMVPSLKGERIPKSFMLDIQSSQGEIQSGMASDKHIGHIVSNVSMTENDIYSSAVNPSPMQAYPALPTTENWQLPVNQSLVSLLTQSGTVDHRISLNESNNISQSLPIHPCPAQLVGPDKSTASTMTNWFNCTQSEASSMHTAQNSRLDKFPFKLDYDNTSYQPTEKSIKKEFVLDIDLNDPSPEAEAEAIESVGYSSGVLSSNSDAAHKMSPAAQKGDEASDGVQTRDEGSDGVQMRDEGSDGVQTRDEASDGVSHVKSETQQPLVLRNPSAVAEASSASIEQTMSGQDVNHANPDSTLSLETHIEAKDAPRVESTVTCEPEPKFDIEVNKEQVSETVNKAPRKLHVLSLPNPEAEDIWNDVPYSPGLEASAKILFHMSRACSLFYAGNSQESEKGTTSSNSASHTVKVSKPRNVGVREIVKASKDSSASESDENNTRKHHITDGKQRSVLSHVRNNSNSPDRSEQQNKNSLSSKSQTKTSMHKESRANNLLVLKKPSVISSPSRSSLDRDNSTSKVRKTLSAEATKLLRESTKRDAIPYPVKSRNANGCSIKPSRHVLPYVEEVKVVASGLK